MDSLRKIIRESIQIAENIQLADKVYFNTGKLPPLAREAVLKITGGDPYTKIISDIAYAYFENSAKTGRWSVSGFDGEKDYDESEVIQLSNDSVKDINTWKEIKELYNQIKTYNKNVFPIEGFDINNPKNIWNITSALKNRAKILELMKKLPSVAARNLSKDKNVVRNYNQLNIYRDELEQFLSYYSLLSNRDPKFRKFIEDKMFKSGVTLEDLLDFVQEKENMLGGKPFTKNSVKRLVGANSYDMEIVYDKGNVMVVDVTSPDAIKKIGCNSLWCFTYGKGFDAAYRQWNQYSTNDHVYVIIDFSESMDSPDFMHVLIQPLDYKAESEDENDSKLFNMANEESYNAVGIVKQLVGDDAPFILNFGESVDMEGPSSKWPYEDPNQLKLDLQEVRKLISEVVREVFSENEIVPPSIPNSMNFWHGGNLDDYGDAIAQKNGRYEYGPGLYITTHYDTAKKYAKGSRKLYLVTVANGVDISDATLDENKVREFVASYVIGGKRKEILATMEKYFSEGKIKANTFNVILLNNKAIKPANTINLRSFLVDNGIDYEIVDNAFGWGEKMIVLYNMKKILNVIQVKSGDKIAVFDLSKSSS